MQPPPPDPVLRRPMWTRPVDLVGRQVAVLSEGRMGAGLDRVPLDVAALAPGVYVARVTTALSSGAVSTASRRLVVAR